MPDFITLIMLATCTGSSLCFWTLGRSIYDGSQPTLTEDDSLKTTEAEMAAKTTLAIASKVSLGGQNVSDKLCTPADDLVEKQNRSENYILIQGDAINVKLRVASDSREPPVVVGKALGRADQVAQRVCRSQSNGIRFTSNQSQANGGKVLTLDNPALARQLYTSVPLLSSVSEALNLELRHTLKFHS